MKFRLALAHRLSRANYIPRVLGFASSFLVLCLLALGRDRSASVFVALALCFLVYPQAVFLLSVRWPRNKVIELGAMLFDSLMLGAWTVEAGFFLWIAYAFLAAVVLNNTMTGGLRQLLLGLILYLLGLLGWGFVHGFHLNLEAPFYLEAMAAGLLLLYLASAAWVFFNQNRRLAGVKRSVEDKNAVFETLLRLSRTADEAGDADQLIERAVQEMHELYPSHCFGLVIREMQRPEVVRHAAFAGVGADDCRDLLRQLQCLEVGDTEIHELGPDAAVMHLRAHLKQNEGLLVVKGASIDRHLRASLRLFADQLGATIENKLLTLELRRAAECDALTGIYNRGYFESELNRVEKQKHRHPDMEFSVILMDAVGLKRVNDCYGHEAGDQLIQSMAGALAHLCRETDLLARFGGDEFVILCSASRLEGARVLAQRIARDINGSEVDLDTEKTGVHRVEVRLSIGVASSSEVAPGEVLRTADARMYRDKDAWYAEHQRYR